ncbi:hypothetical protein T484DRAFT_3201116 [Baffinella frigidus]|nr:hypothetical protein T484DRAFT_3201116 [Cryptophyta sp. CCMP2293]
MKHPREPPCIPSSQASALESSTRSERKKSFPAVLSTEGRVVGICWEKLKPQGPKEGRGQLAGTRLGDSTEWRWRVRAGRRCCSGFGAATNFSLKKACGIAQRHLSGAPRSRLRHQRAVDGGGRTV